MGGLKLATISGEPHDHGRGGHRQRTAQSHTRLPRHAMPGLGQADQNRYQQQGEANLDTAKSEHQAAHCTEFRQAKFQSDGKHQKHHADFCEPAGNVGIRCHGEGMWPEQDPDRQIADQGGQLERPRCRYRTHGNGKQDNDDPE